MTRPADELLTRLNTRYASLSKSEQRVAEYVRQYPEEIVLQSLQALARQCDTSDATVMRFCRAIGYSGFQDMKSNLIPDMLRRGYHPGSESSDQDPSFSYQTRLAEDSRRTLGLLSTATVDSVAQALITSNQNIIVGLAGSAGVARIFADSLASVGLPATTLSDRVEIERACDRVDRKDVVFAISHSGETPEVISAVERGRNRQAHTVGMTNFSPSSLEQAAEHVFLTSAAEGMLGSYSCHPRVLELVVLEMLISKVGEKLALVGDGL